MFTIVQVIWVDENNSEHYISRLNKFLNPNNEPLITTAMWNKEILPNEKNKTHTFNRFMIVFNFDKTKTHQKCFSFSSPKLNDNRNDLRYFILPNKQKVMLNSAIDIPTKYLKTVDFNKMIKRERNYEVKRTLWYSKLNFDLARNYEEKILEQYETISKRKLTGNIRYDENIKHAHKTMIDDEKQKEFCNREVKLINDFQNKPIYDKKLSQKDNLKNELEWTKMIEKQKKEQLLEINCNLFHLQHTAKQLEEKIKGLSNYSQLTL